MPSVSPAEPFSTAAVDALDPLVVNPGRLSILLALAEPAGGVEFVHLRRRTRLTDGNLACHARRLADGGMIDVDKQFRAGKPVTAFRLTDAGRRALTAHVRTLVAAVGPGGAGGAWSAAPAALPPGDERAVAIPERSVSPMAWAVAGGSDDDDWVD